MICVGRTEQKQVYAMRRDKPFVIDQYLKINDKENGNPIARVIESYEYTSIYSIYEHRPYYKDIKMKVPSVNKDSKPIYVAKLKIENEISKPIKSFSELSIPTFNEIKKLIMKNEDGLNLGIIRGSDSMYDTLPDNLKNISPMLSDGKIQKQKELPFIFDVNSFDQYPHLGLFGGSGSGKTYGFNVILEEIIKKGIPSIILDPHYEMNFDINNKSIPEELRCNYKDKVETFQIGKNIGIPFVDITTGELIEILMFVGNLTPPMTSTLQSLHSEGDTMALLNNRLETLIRVFELEDKRELDVNTLTPHELKMYNTYKMNVSSLATLKALQWRLKAIESEGIFNNNIMEARKALFNRKTIVIRGNNRHLNILSSYMIKKFYKSRRLYIDGKENNKEDINKFPPFIVCMDEAHNFAPKSEYSSPTKNTLKNIAQEGRKYGVYLILATQRPAILDETIVSQLSSKIIFRTTISEDIKMIEKETDLDKSEVSRLPYLKSGNAFLSSAIISNTLSIRFRANFTEGKIKKHPFDELNSFNSNDFLEEEILKLLPFNDSSLEDVLNTIKEKDENINIMDIEKEIINLVDKGLINRVKTMFGYHYE